MISFSTIHLEGGGMISVQMAMKIANLASLRDVVLQSHINAGAHS